MDAERLLSLCIKQRTDASLPSLTSPPKYRIIGAMGIAFASTEPLNRPALRTLDQSCADIRNLHISRASVRYV